MVEYVYNELGQRIIKKLYNSSYVEISRTYYVGDVIYTQTVTGGILGTAVAQEYEIDGGSGRLGIYYRPATVYAYQLTDHLGNVRAVVAKSGTNLQVRMYSDFYPYGMVITPVTTGTNDYRYGYQGQYAEKDPETDWNAFELRMYDSKIARWLSVDPKRQFHSPYIGMGNNPVSGVDPDGGEVNPILDSETGELLGTDNLGLQGEAIVMSKSLFTQGMDHAEALKSGTLLSNFKGPVDLKIKMIGIQYGLVNRPDFDGVVTDMEARKWWQENSGMPLYVDVSKMQLNPLATKHFSNQENKRLYYNFFLYGYDETMSRVYGTVSVRLLNVHTGEVQIGNPETKFIDEYDFNPDGRIVRDATTFLARKLFAGEGKELKIYGYGNNPKVQSSIRR